VKLKQGQRFKITVGSGRSARSQNVRCTPPGFPPLKTTGNLPSSHPFLALSIPVLFGPAVPYAIALDARGVPIWWRKADPVPTRDDPTVLRDPAVIDVRPAPNGRMAFWSGDLRDEIAGGGSMGVYRLDGTKERSISTTAHPASDPHESLPTARGTWYRAYVATRTPVDLSPFSASPTATVGDVVIEEIDAAGRVVWSWLTKDHIDIAETERWLGVLHWTIDSIPGRVYDIIHINSIEEDGKGGVIISMRHTDSVIRIDKATGQITWKLGGTPTSKSLTVIDDTPHVGGTFGGQHDARVMPDGTITVYDNGSGFTGRAPRATRWRIDPTAKTATLVEELKDREIPASAGGGSARKLPDGTWIVAWSNSRSIRAYDRTGKRSFDLNTGNTGVPYRATPIPASQFTLAQFAAGMDAQAPR
jgi:hypothetical protein